MIAAGPAMYSMLGPASQVGSGKRRGKVLLPIGDGSELMDTMYAYYRILEDEYEVVVCGPETRWYHLLLHENALGGSGPVP